MSSRSNSASAAKMPNTSLPHAVVVSMAALMPGQDLQTDPALGEIVDQVNELPGSGPTQPRCADVFHGWTRKKACKRSDSQYCMYSTYRRPTRSAVFRPQDGLLFLNRRRDALEADCPPEEAWQRVIAAARAERDATERMTHRLGRASCLGARAIGIPGIGAADRILRTTAGKTEGLTKGRRSIVKKCPMSCLVLALATLPLAASAQDAKLDRAGVTVGTLGNPFFVPLIKGAEDGLKAGNANVEVTVVGADYDLNKQASQLDSFIGSNAKIIMLNAVDAVAIKPFVAKAKAAGIIVAAMDVSADGADLTVMTNNVQAGELACEDLAKRLNGKGVVVIINGPPVSSIIDRVKGCKQAFAKYPGVNILSDNQDGKASREGGLAVMQALLTRFPKIDAVFGANDPTAIGAELAAKQLKRSEMIIAGVDGSPDFVTALKREGTLLVSSSAQDPYGMAKMAAEKAVALMHGVRPEPATTLLDTKLVTKENVGNYVGWDGGR